MRMYLRYRSALPVPTGEWRLRLQREIGRTGQWRPAERRLSTRQCKTEWRRLSLARRRQNGDDGIGFPAGRKIGGAVPLRDSE